ncbi:GmrSD restriction endonuclease domain-containing protein [Pseudonocardia xinjiangensis]|uniref:GmrSD restriction endonuclease domain-containing protein n=1 Tax=Pseudonocardia xinjiangensis TaxID=75289 RepID=UPI003D8E5FC3
MHVEKSERSIGDLIAQITAGEIKLPELQRDFVWKPSQVAKLVDSLYRGYPSGSLLFWQADEAPMVRAMSVAGDISGSMHAPLYLLDGQQRLTSLHRVITGHPDAQIVFHVGTERFQNQSASTRTDPRWVRVSELVDPNTSLLQLLRRLVEADLGISETEIERRLSRVRSMRERAYHLEILKNFPYEEIAQIFVRVNSAGRRLSTLDLATATLSSRWPGVLAKLESEADQWRREGFGEVDVPFLSRAFAGAVLGRGLSVWSHSRLAAASDTDLERGWQVIQTGLGRLIPLLRDTLGVTRSDVLPSMVALIPLAVLLGERPEGRLDDQTTNGILYWLLIATASTRYSGSTDTVLSQDIQAAREPDPVQSLLALLRVFDNRPRIDAESLRGRTKDSPLWFLALLATRRRGARDWWHGTELLSGRGNRTLASHQIHPTITLSTPDRKRAHDLANLVFVSADAAQIIGSRSPREYFNELKPDELARHCVPLEPALRDPAAFNEFLDTRRRLLADAITELLDVYRPAWLDRLPGLVGPPNGPMLTLALYGGAWDTGSILFTVSGEGRLWTGTAAMADLKATVLAVGKTGLDGELDISGEPVPVEVIGDQVVVPIGPYDVSGTVEEWVAVFERERADARPPFAAPTNPLSEPWQGDRVPFAVAASQ